VLGLPVAALGLAGYVAILLTSWSRSELARAGQVTAVVAVLVLLRLRAAAEA
jgi:hypothetical protein